jgi:hypothetical protein
MATIAMNRKRGRRKRGGNTGYIRFAKCGQIIQQEAIKKEHAPSLIAPPGWQAAD